MVPVKIFRGLLVRRKDVIDVLKAKGQHER